MADALIRVHNYSDAIKNYKTLYNGTPENLHYRYGRGRALLYDGQYKEAIDLLRGVGTEFDDGGSAGQARILEAAAHYGAAMHTTTDFEKKMKIDMAVKSLCEGLQITTYDWRKLIEGDSDEGGFSQIRIILINIYPPSCTSQKGLIPLSQGDLNMVSCRR